MLFFVRRMLAAACSGMAGCRLNCARRLIDLLQALLYWHPRFLVTQ